VRAARAEEHNTRSPEQLCELRAGRGAQTRRGAVPRCARGRTRGGSTLTLTTVTALHLLLPSLPCQPGTASGNTYVWARRYCWRPTRGRSSGPLQFRSDIQCFVSLFIPSSPARCVL